MTLSPRKCNVFKLAEALSFKLACLLFFVASDKLKLKHDRFKEGSGELEDLTVYYI